MFLTYWYVVIRLFKKFAVLMGHVICYIFVSLTSYTQLAQYDTLTQYWTFPIYYILYQMFLFHYQKSKDVVQHFLLVNYFFNSPSFRDVASRQ
jgi:hypothetical protein